MSEQESSLMVHNAIERVCQVLGDVSVAEIASRDRTERVASARQLVYWYLHRLCKMGVVAIGRAMGRSHAAVLIGVRQAETILERNRGKADRRIVEASKKLLDGISRRVEDKIAEIIRGAEPSRSFSVVKMRDYLSFESDFEFGDLGGYVTVRYESHEDEDGELVADGIEDIEVVCCDANNEQVKIDMDYLLDKI